jgi:hypothetical protein
MDGILAYLRNQYKGNLHDLHVVEVTANHNGNSLSYVVNLELNWISGQTPDGWVCIDLKKRRIKLTHYSIRSSNCAGQNERHPREWAVEVAESSDWVEVDRRGPHSDLNGRLLIGTYEVKKPMICRFVRLRPLSKNCAGTWEFLFNAVEFFGDLFEELETQE